MKLVRPVTVTDAVLTTSSITESETLWSSVTAYTTGNAVYRVIDNVHRRFVALQNSTNKVPEDEPTYWEDQGATNRWAMFDKSVQSQSTDSNSIAVELSITGRIDTVALLNVSAASATITLTDAVEGVIYDETYSLTSTVGINNWAAYFREPIERLNKLIVSDLPPYANPTLDVSLDATGVTVSCGVLIAGRSRQIGETLMGPRLGITDFSVKQADEFGDYIVVERAFADTAEFQVLTENNFVDAAHALLASWRATPILYVGSGDYASMAVYGFFRDFNIEVAYPTHSLISISLEGLT